MNRTERQLTSAEIQKEQTFLVELERELTNVLDKVNENLNTLKVEELQLRSNAVNVLKKHEIKKSPERTKSVFKQEEPPTFIDNPDMVNHQELDLDVYLSHFNDEEVDE